MSTKFVVTSCCLFAASFLSPNLANAQAPAKAPAKVEQAVVAKTPIAKQAAIKKMIITPKGRKPIVVIDGAKKGPSKIKHASAHRGNDGHAPKGCLCWRRDSTNTRWLPSQNELHRGELHSRQGEADRRAGCASAGQEEVAHRLISGTGSSLSGYRTAITRAYRNT
ncbi:MAG: hypothetical protein JKY56_27010 [Kofleriaceae bacterium]|nr:hypothetical protein [Kofleriaceae bacterium]